MDNVEIDLARQLAQTMMAVHLYRVRRRDPNQTATVPCPGNDNDDSTATTRTACALPCPQNEQQDIRRWTQELADGLMEDSRRTHTDEEVRASADRILDTALTQYRKGLAAALVVDPTTTSTFSRMDTTTTTQPATTTKPSVSLLGSLASYKLPPRMDWDDIAARRHLMTPSMTLELLQSLDANDDDEYPNILDTLQDDWDLVRSLLWEGWRTTLMQAPRAMDDNHHHHHQDNDDDVLDNRRAYLRLYRTWSEQLDNSTSTWLKYDLCHDVAKGMRHYSHHLLAPSTSSILMRSADNTTSMLDQDEDFLWDLVCTWHDLWSASYTQFTPRQSQSIVSSVLLCLQVVPPQDMTAVATRAQGRTRMPITPGHCLALYDRHAQWFHTHVQSLSPHQVLDLVHDWLRTSTFVFDSHSQDIITTNTNTWTMDAKLQCALQTHKLSMLRSILVTTRVAFFPWWRLGRSEEPFDLATLLMSDEIHWKQQQQEDVALVHQVPSVDHVCRLGALFLGMLAGDRGSTPTPETVDVVGEAWEALLWGCLDEKKCVLELLGLLQKERMKQRATEWDSRVLQILVELAGARGWSSTDEVYQCIVRKMEQLRAL